MLGRLMMCELQIDDDYSKIDKMTKTVIGAMIGTIVEKWVQNEIANGHKIELTDGHKSWNNSWATNWFKNRIHHKLMGGHNSWSRNWQDNKKLTGHSIEAVGQAMGVRPDRRCRQITFGVDTAACRTVVPEMMVLHMPAFTVHVHRLNILSTFVTLHVSRGSALTICCGSC